MAKVGSLLIDLGLNMARLQTDVGKANQRIQSMERNFSKSLKGIERQFRGVTRALGRFTAAIGVTAGAGGLAMMARSTINAADEIQKLSLRLGASTEALSEYQHVAALSDVSNQTLTLGWQRMTRRIAEAAQGTGEARGALEELRLEAATLNGLRPEQQFEIIADAMQGVENQSDKVRLAMKLFDSEGVALLQTMTRGADGIREMRAEARGLGLTLSQDAADAAANANDTITRLAGSIRGTLAQALTTVGPYLTEFFDRLSGKKTPLLVAGQISELNTEIATTRMLISNTKNDPSMFEVLRDSVGTESLAEKVGRLNAELQRLLDKRSELMGIQQDNLPEFPANQLGGPSQIVSRNPELEERQAALREALANMVDMENQFTMSIQALSDQRKATAELEANHISSLRQGMTNSAIGLLQTLGQKNKAAAIAAVLIQKAQAIQSINIERAKALQAARVWSYLYGYAADAKFAQAAAQINTLAAANMGLVAATGIAEIQNINSGAGTATGGVPPSSNTVGGQASQAPQQQVVQQQYIFNAPVYGIEEFDEKVVQANQSFIRREGILIEKNTRQALEFARG